MVDCINACHENHVYVMKPILEWYEDLPEPYRSQAINNYFNSGESASKADNLGSALLAGFNWFDSPEGFEYWEYVQYRYISGEFDKHK